MNEQDLFHEMIQDHIVNNDRILLRAHTQKQKKPLAWRRVLIPIVTALAVTCGLIMAIPSARAEVLSWFTPSSAAEYLGVGSEDREPVPELDAMIVTSAPSQTQITVNYVADEPYWREIGEHFSATLGETIFDGNDIYISIDFDGLSGYPLFENAWCPSLPADALLPTLLAEAKYTVPHNDLILTLEDGSQLPAWMEPIIRPVDDAMIQAFHGQYGYHASYDEETAVAWREKSFEHCKANGVRAVAGIAEEQLFHPSSDKTVSDHIDENGCLTFHVRYLVSLDSFDYTEASETKLDVDLGTVTVNMTAYRDLKQRSIKASQEPITLSGDAVFEERWGSYQSDRAGSYAANLDGVTLRVIEPGTVDLLGVHGISILLTMPDDWSEAQMEAFARNLLFDVVVDDSISISYGGGLEPVRDRSCILTLDLGGCIPFDRIQTMQKITLTPVLHPGDESTHPDRTITLSIGD